MKLCTTFICYAIIHTQSHGNKETTQNEIMISFPKITINRYV